MKAQDESGIKKDFPENATEWMKQVSKGAPMGILF
jgi:hypothetical protein